MRKNGFTLVEILIVMVILVMIVMMMIGTFNAIGVTNKGRDARRKKDLNRIKIAFEEYFNDKGEFPTGTLLVDLKDKKNCGSSSVFAPYLNPWPCDPNGNPYYIHVENNQFRIITNLENKKDKDIPEGWYIKNDFNFPVLSLATNDANYGVSSANILWYDGLVRDYSMCNVTECFNGDEGCKDVTHSGGCFGNDCFYSNSSLGGCIPECSVPCCGDKCNQ